MIEEFPPGSDLPWVLALLFFLGIAEQTSGLIKKHEASSPPSKNITQLEVNLLTKEAGLFWIFKNDDLFSQGSFNNVQELTKQIKNIEKGYIDTDNQDLSIGDLIRFKNNMNLSSMQVYHVR